MFDTDGGGTLQAEEIKKALTKFGLKSTDN